MRAPLPRLFRFCSVQMPRRITNVQPCLCLVPAITDCNDHGYICRMLFARIGSVSPFFQLAHASWVTFSAKKSCGAPPVFHVKNTAGAFVVRHPFASGFAAWLPWNTKCGEHLAEMCF